MAVNYTDFDKIWASTSPLTPYEFSESQYKEGWNFVGNTPPSRQMWDKFMQQADEKMQYLYNHESVPVGHEYFTFNPNIPQGSLPLFGGEYSRETYADLWAWVQEQTGYLKTEAEWQTLATANGGNVPFYSDGDGSTTFRVPSLKCWVKGANGTVSEVGSYLAAGLPNITGSFRYAAEGAGFLVAKSISGAFYGSSDKTSVPNITTETTVTATPMITNLDASRSSSIYGNSTTVQPPSIVGMWLVKAYGVVEDTGTIDEQQYIDDRLATKLSLTGGTMLGAIKGDSVTLTAENGGNSASLVLNNNGSATWNGKEVERVNASGTDYIRYESGLQLCWGNANGSGDSTGKTVTFPVAFKDTNISVVAASKIVTVSPSYGINVQVGLFSTTSFNLKYSVNGSWSTSDVSWFAIGYWK